MKCDACQQDKDKSNEIQYLCHIDDIITGGNLQDRYTDNEGNAVSGRKIVKHLCNGCYNRVMTEAVKKINSIRNEKIIDAFMGEYRWLSNFHIDRKHPIVYLGCVGISVEHVFQAYKTQNKKQRDEILNAKTPGEAKRLGKVCTKRPEWEEIKYNVMLACVEYKFHNNFELAQRLLNTGEAILIEGNTWHDNTWGNCICGECRDIDGKNWLGKILMEVRSKLKLTDVALC